MTDALHPATLSIEQLLADCDVERLRRSGPGGQHRNKVETAIRLTHRPTGVTAMASERRSQRDNLTQAVKRLRVTLALEVRTRSPDCPTERWKSRCVQGRISVNRAHADYPPLLAEALDALAAADWDPSRAADQLGCTLSQLLKFLRGEPRAWQLLNRESAERYRRTYQ
ncbi:MAG: peptide chain release factor-like protein [Planctomycetaceae bacterium]|nr:peptide chain release factor-like protein [Planctomycetaceae bacterium]